MGLLLGIPNTVLFADTAYFQVSISPTLNKQLLHTKILKAQKDTDCFFVLLGSARVKDARIHVGEIDPRSPFSDLVVRALVSRLMCLPGQSRP